MSRLVDVLEFLVKMINHLLGANSISKDTQKSLLFFLVAVMVVFFTLIIQAIVLKWFIS